MSKDLNKINLLNVASEVFPFTATGGMGQVAGALSTAIAKSKSNVDVRVVTPLYAAFRDKFEPQMKFLGETTVKLSWRSVYCGVYTLTQDGVTYYFVDNRDYFGREKIYGYLDDGERFAFLSMAVFSVIELSGFRPNVIHAHDWQAALVPIYLKVNFAHEYHDVKVVFTIHNIEYQGKFANHTLGDVFDLPAYSTGIVEYDGCLNLMKGAIVCADKITTVSPSYAEEIKQFGGYGLEPIIRENAYKLSGIINGIDTKYYDPKTDSNITKNYSIKTIKDKLENKTALQKTFKLPEKPRSMLICVVSRLVAHKGVDLITYLMEDLLQLDVQFLLLGTGDQEYELFFEELMRLYPKQVSVSIAYNPEIASKIYAGADVVLMPSQSEPCGLTQMICCRYGTIPIVRKTGGLGDTILDCRNGNGNGFVFEEYDSAIFFEAIKDAYDLYMDREADWKNLMKEAMKSEFGWDSSVKAYVDLYRQLT